MMCLDGNNVQCHCIAHEMFVLQCERNRENVCVGKVSFLLWRIVIVSLYCNVDVQTNVTCTHPVHSGT